MSRLAAITPAALVTVRLRSNAAAAFRAMVVSAVAAASPLKASARAWSAATFLSASCGSASAVRLAWSNACLVCRSRMSYLSIAALIVGLPIPLVLSSLLAARRGRLERGCSTGLCVAPAASSRQFLNVPLLCGLLTGTLFTRAYDASALDFSEGAYRTLLAAFVGGLLVLLLVAAVPLKHARLASNLLALCGSLFIAAQLVMI